MYKMCHAISAFWMRGLAFGLLLLAMQACVLHPAYRPPLVEIPSTWRIAVDESSSYANAGWWQQFNDRVLDALIQEALAGNMDLKVAIARVYEFAGQLQIVRSDLYPQISGNLGSLRQESSLFVFPPTAGFSRTYDIFSCLLNASYDIDIWGEIRSASEASLAELLGSVEARRGVVLTLVTAVASSYIELRQFDLQLEISKQTLISRQESYQLAMARYLGGLTSELEAKQAEALMESAALQVLQYEIAVAQKENLLSVLLGHPPYAIERGLALDSLTLPPKVPAGLPSELLQQRPDIFKAEDALIAANAQIGVAKAQFFPSITLTGNYGNQSLQLSRLLTNPAETWQFAASLLQPIFTGGRLTGQLAVAEAQKKEAYYLYRQTVLNAFKEVDDALIAHQKSRELLIVQQRRVDAYKTSLHLAHLQYDNGQVDYLNVLDAERNVFISQLDMAESQSFTFLSLINLYKALGGGWVVAADGQALNTVE